MRYQQIIYIISLLILFISCENTNKNRELLAEELRQKELKLKEQEILIKEREVQLQEQELQKLKEKQPTNDLPQIYKNIKPSVYLIYTLNSEGVSQGSAFVINPYGIAISNFHVFEQASEAIAVNENGEEFQISEILDYNQDRDYIIFRLNTLKKLSYLEISDILPEIGEECFAVGNPEGLTQTLSKGIISSYRDNNKLIQTTTEITHGSSGGPLFNSSGKVIGITTGGRNSANLNFAVNISTVPYLSYLHTSNSVDTNHSAINKENIKNLISQYYYCVGNEMFHKLSDMYAPSLKRYFSRFNISRSEAVRIAQDYNRKFGVISTNYDVRWDSLQINEFENGNYSVNYIMDYTLNRQNKNKPSHFVLNIIVEINNNYQIESIYENILAKR